MVSQPVAQWVLLNYRIPREPSTPRITIWRKLKDLGVAQLGDGLVALPADARNQERLEWIAESVREADGSAIVWTATPTRRRDGAAVAADMGQAREREYDALLADVAGDPEPDPRSVRRWRRQWRRVSRRDFFRASNRDAARLAIDHAAKRAGLAKEKLA